MQTRLDLLSDLKILDLSRIFTGPFCSQILGDLGAEIIKVEPPKGDDTRYWGPPFVAPGMSSYFASLNRNKLSITLDFTNDEEWNILRDLVGWADIVIENYRPGVATKLNLNFDKLKEINPKLVYLSITGFGPDGPFRDHPSYDIIAQSESGIMGITGTEEGEIAKVGIPVGDISAAMYGAIGILAAIRKRDQTGTAQLVETNLFGSLTSWLTYQSMNGYLYNTPPEPLGTAHPNIVPYQSFKCKDNQYLSLAIGNEKLWKGFKDALVDDRLEDEKFSTNQLRVKNRELLIPILEKIFVERPSDEWYNQLRESSIPVGKVRNISEVHDHPQMKHSEQIILQQVEGVQLPFIQTPLTFNKSGNRSISNPPNQDEDRSRILQIIRGGNKE